MVAKRYPLSTLETLKRTRKDAHAKELSLRNRECGLREREVLDAVAKRQLDQERVERVRSDEQGQLELGQLRVEDLAARAGFEEKAALRDSELARQVERAREQAAEAQREAVRSEQALVKSRVELSSVEAQRERWEKREHARSEAAADEDAEDIAQSAYSRRQTGRDA